MKRRYVDDEGTVHEARDVLHGRPPGSHTRTRATLCEYDGDSLSCVLFSEAELRGSRRRVTCLACLGWRSE